MLSHRHYRIFGLIITWAGFVGGTPFAWNWKSNRLKVKPTCLLLHSIGIMNLLLYTVFLVTQVVRHLLMKKPMDFEFFFLYALAVCAVIDCIAAYPIARRPYHFAAVINNFHEIMENIHGRVFS